MKNSSSHDPWSSRDTAQILIAILREEISGSPFAAHGFTDDVWTDVLELARKHDLAHLVADWLLRREAPATMTDALKRIKALAQYRCISQQKVLSSVCSHFDTAHIEHIPLKGAVLRTLYPSSWMRTCADIDILIRQEELSRAEQLLKDKMKVNKTLRGSHDVKLTLSDNIAVELHYKLMEDHRVNGVSEQLADVWRYSVGDSFKKAMSDEMFYFYHIAHMAKHFENGGCGIRPFMDLWLLRHKSCYDEAAVTELLKRCNLTVFERKAVALSEKWFSEERCEGITQIEQYILSGGLFGSFDRTVSNRKLSYGGTVPYMLHRVFASYDDLKVLYPVLEKHRSLTPLFEVVRWFRFKDRDSRKHTLSELKQLNHKTDDLQEIMHDMGLV